MKGVRRMRITITGKNIEVSDYLNDLVIKKVSKLDKYFPEDTEAHVTLAVERNRHIVEVTIPYTGGIIRGEETSGDMYASIDNVLAKLEKQIMRHRTKLEKSLRAGAFKAPEPVFADSFSADEDEMEEAPRVVKVKRFDIKPMTVEEAMLSLNCLATRSICSPTAIPARSTSSISARMVILASSSPNKPGAHS